MVKGSRRIIRASILEFLRRPLAANDDIPVCLVLSFLGFCHDSLVLMATLIPDSIRPGETP